MHASKPAKSRLWQGLDSGDEQALASLMTSAIRSASAALSEMAGRPIAASATRIRMVPLTELNRVGGDPERPALAVYIGVRGDERGHIVLSLSESTARTFVAMLLDEPEGADSPLTPMEISALAEAGNIATSFFLTALADSAHLSLPPTPPIVLHEMRGAIFDSLAAITLAEREDALLIETQFTCNGRVAEMAFYAFPAPGMIEAVANGMMREANDPGDLD